MVEGILTDIGSSNVNIATIAAPVTIIIVVLLITIISLCLLLGYKFHQNRKKSEYDVKFSVKDEAGSLAKALKVFKDLKINVGVNTHLHHAEFDRKAEKGYNYNYIYCHVSSSEINFLRDELKAEILGECDGNGDEHLHDITAIVKVKDGPGGLWEVLDKIGKRRINLTGVNTGDKHESCAGFRETHVKCSCSSDIAKRLSDCLTAIGAMNVKIELHVHKSVTRRSIQYLVRDEVGALAGTLEVFTTVGLNISGVNVDHLGGADRNTKNNLRLNFIECSVDDQTLETLKTTLKKNYGAIEVECEQDSLGRNSTDPHYRILRITILNETGSLNRALKAFSVLNINLHGVNILEPVFIRDYPIVYKHYHLEVVATAVQFAQLADSLYSKGLATDVKEFNILKYCKDVSKLSQQYKITLAHAAQQQIHDNDSTPRAMMIEFFVRDEVGALAQALQIFGGLGISISKVNPAHMGSHHQSEYVECVCEKDKRDALLAKMLSCGANKAEFLPDSEVPPSVDAEVPNYCVVKLSVGSNPTDIVDVLKAFPAVGADVAKVNPNHIKHHDQYVECCCTDDVLKELLTKLKNIEGVIHVRQLPPSEEHASEQQMDNYCVIQFSVREEAGILVNALKAFFVLNINILGVNTLTPVFERVESRIYKHNHVDYVGTKGQEDELRKNLLVTGLAIDVKAYEHKQRDTEEVKVGAEEVHIDVETKV